MFVYQKQIADDLLILQLNSGIETLNRSNLQQIARAVVVVADPESTVHRRQAKKAASLQVTSDRSLFATTRVYILLHIPIHVAQSASFTFFLPVALGLSARSDASTALESNSDTSLTSWLVSASWCRCVY